MNNSTQYIRMANGSFKLAGMCNPSPWSDSQRPELNPTEVLDEVAQQSHVTLAENVFLLRCESVAKGEGHAREQKAYVLNGREIPMPMIDSPAAWESWLESVSFKPSAEDSEYALFVMCRRLAMKWVQFLRVMERDMHASIAEEAADRACLALLTASTTRRVRGANKGKTKIDASLERGKGSFHPMQFVGWIVKHEVQTTLTDKGITFTQDMGRRYTELQDHAAVAESTAHDTNAFIRSLATAADKEESSKGTTTLRRDMFRLYNFLRFDRQLTASVASKTGNVSREAIMEHFGWSKNHYGRVLCELKCAHAHWFMSEENALVEDARLRDLYQRGFVGIKASKVAA